MNLDRIDTRLARRQDGKLIHAKKGIDKSLPFYCLSCGEEVFGVTRDRKQTPHFRHKSSHAGNRGCSDPESIIHWYAKELFAEHYRETDSFFLLLDVTKKCIHAKYDTCLRSEKQRINLKEIYPYIAVEKKEGDFRPDCLLYNDDGEKVFFEVCYTSAVSREKIESGTPIIELHIKDQEAISLIIEAGELEITKRDKDRYRQGKKKPHVNLYNKESILFHTNTTFNCDGNCHVENRIKEREKQEEVQRRIDAQNRAFAKMREEKKKRTKPKITKKPTPKLKAKQYTPLVDNPAIDYLVEYKKNIRERRYHKETVIPVVLAKTKEEYMGFLKKHKGLSLDDVNPRILEQTDTMLFLHYKGLFFGAVRYEAYWHAFSLEEDKIKFIVSRKEKSWIIIMIKAITNIF